MTLDKSVYVCISNRESVVKRNRQGFAEGKPRGPATGMG